MLCFGAYFGSIIISADEYTHPSADATGDIKYIMYPNKLTAVADGKDKISFTIGAFYISECVPPPGTTGVCDPDSIGASPTNPRPTNGSLGVISAKSGLQTGHTPSITAANLIPYINNDDIFTMTGGSDYKDANNIYYPRTIPTGYTTISLNSTISGQRRVMLIEKNNKHWIIDSTYSPLIFFDVNFSPAPPPPTPSPVNANTNTALPPIAKPNSNTTSSSSNSNANIPTSSPSATNSTSPNKSNNFNQTKATGQIINRGNDAIALNLPPTFTIEIGAINDKKPEEFETTPLSTKDAITISGTSNLPETKLAFEIQSEPILKVETVTDKMGNWSIQIPQKLSENLHTIYVFALDSNGQALTEKIKLSEFNVVKKKEIIVSKADSQKNQRGFFSKNGGKIILGFGALSLIIFIILVIHGSKQTRPQIIVK